MRWLTPAFVPVFDLLDNRCPVVPGSDYDAWYYVDRAFLRP